MTSATSVNTWWLAADNNNSLTCFISDYNTPPMNGFGKGLNFQSVLYTLNMDVTKSKLLFFSAALNSFSAPTNLVPLSEKNGANVSLVVKWIF